jgi:hypothetical protein
MEMICQNPLILIILTTSGREWSPLASAKHISKPIKSRTILSFNHALELDPLFDTVPKMKSKFKELAGEGTTTGKSSQKQKHFKCKQLNFLYCRIALLIRSQFHIAPIYRSP